MKIASRKDILEYVKSVDKDYRDEEMSFMQEKPSLPTPLFNGV
jgi:hypothetical protein